MKNPALLCIIIATVLTGCQTTKVSPASTEEAKEYRETQDELRTRQAETAITGAKIEGGAREIVAGLDALESAMASVPEADPWLPQVQSLRARAGALQQEAETLNRQLAGERENSRRLDAKFNDYETASSRDIAEKDAKINALQIENKKVSGQRNTLLAIIAVIVVILAVKILRALRIIPI
jgi:capsule polysaccharide export protein KpsE/RkpR